MDKTSKKITNYLKQHPDDLLMYNDEPWKHFDISEDEFYRCVQYLGDNDLINFASNQNGIHIGIAPTHKIIHSREIKRDSFLFWLFHDFWGGVIIGALSTFLADIAIHLF